MVIRKRPPTWYWIVAILAALWGAAGLAAFYADMTMSADAVAGLSDHDRALRAAMPDWLQWVYGLATWAGFLGAVGLFMKRRSAVLLFLISLFAGIVQFGYIFAAIDIIAVKGAGVVIFPVIVALIAVAELWFARLAVRRAWIV